MPSAASGARSSWPRTVAKTRHPSAFSARAQCAPMPTDRYLAPDIERATALVTEGALSSVFRNIDGLPTLWKAV